MKHNQSPVGQKQGEIRKKRYPQHLLIYLSNFEHNIVFVPLLSQICVNKNNIQRSIATQKISDSENQRQIARITKIRREQVQLHFYRKNGRITGSAPSLAPRSSCSTPSLILVPLAPHRHQLRSSSLLLLSLLLTNLGFRRRQGLIGRAKAELRSNRFLRSIQVLDECQREGFRRSSVFDFFHIERGLERKRRFDLVYTFIISV